MECISVYVHIPFCIQRCGYCDFNTYTGHNRFFTSYVEAICKEIEYIASSFGGMKNIPVHTIYFGGGTPSLLPPFQISKILETLEFEFHVLSDCEITLEANPGTLTREDLNLLKKIGINRMSFGVQSTDKNELEFLGRKHGFGEVRLSIENARQVGFNNINLDLIFGLPKQSLEVWRKSLTDILDLYPEHLSVYALTIEPGTSLYAKVSSGNVPEPDPDLTADMYDLKREILSQNGYLHYEISNWAKNYGQGVPPMSIHNRQYWKNQAYIGLGAGAHSYFNSMRIVNELYPIRYIKRLRKPNIFQNQLSPTVVDVTKIDLQQEMRETMIMGLRLLKEGVSLNRFYERFKLNMQKVFEIEIDLLLEKNLVYWGGEDSTRLLLEERAYFLANQVFVEFV